MTTKLTVLTPSGVERTYVDPKGFYLYKSKDGGTHAVLDEDGRSQLVMECCETQVLPSKHDERIWLCHKWVEDGKDPELTIDQYQVIGWRMDLSLTNGEQTLVPVSPAFDFGLISSTNADYCVLLVNVDLATSIPLVCNGRTGDVTLDVESMTTDPLGFLSHRFGMTITASMLPANVFTDRLDSKLIPPANNTRSA